MLANFLKQHHIVLQKGHNLHICFFLLINKILHIKLKVYKWLHGIRRPIVHYYTVCWNEEQMLPWVFDYYGRFVDRFYVFDNYSTDNTAAIVAREPKAKLLHFGRPDKFDDFANQQIKNQAWKHSRGHADLVIVCDTDEFLYASDINTQIEQIVRHGITLPTTKGYEMYHDTWPPYDSRHLLTDLVTKGVRSHWLDKNIVFDPHRIVEINYTPGAHQAKPVGIINHGNENNIFYVLHFKHLGIDTILTRYRILGKRLSQFNKKNNLGLHYLQKEEELKNQFAQGMAEAENIIDKNHTV